MSFVSLYETNDERMVKRGFTRPAHSTQSKTVKSTIWASASLHIAGMCFRSGCRICFRSCIW